jgi:hypothetical protein
MKRLVLLMGAALAAAGCFTGPKEIPPKKAAFVTDDCVLIAAVARDHYKLTRDAPQLRLRLHGEDLPWRPGCDWQGLGFNLIEVSGPEGLAATAGMSEVSFYRPQYDNAGAAMRTAIERTSEASVRELCRLARTDAVWSVDSCIPDPKVTAPRLPAPSPADATPDSKAPAPQNRPLTPRDLTIPQPDPGAPTP